jgi:Holliday junction resolvasome RuvABC DNA-binding subunit
VAVPEPAGGTGPDADVRADLLSALANLGYQRGAVEKTVDKAIASTDDHSFEPLLRATLKLLLGR